MQRVSWCKNLILIILATFFVGCVQNIDVPKKNVNFAKEDELIVHALHYQNTNEFKMAANTFSELFENTKKEEYFWPMLYSFILAGDKNETLKIIANNKSSFEKLPNNTLGFVYDNLNDYNSATIYYQKSYEDTKNITTLLTLSDMLYIKARQKSRAKEILIDYVNKNGCSQEVCFKLLQYYETEQDMNGTLYVIGKLYIYYKQSNNMSNALKIGELLFKSLSEMDVNLAVGFMEKYDIDDIFLLQLYKKQANLEKSYNQSLKLYKKTNDANYLGQAAIIEYEKARNKISVIKSVSEKFEKALAAKENHQFLNFYGYLLIDHDIDYKKGIELVNRALKFEPNNYAYVDSLAWGQYKIKDCKNANINMQRVVEKVGFEDSEIKLHLEKIKNCKK